VVVEDEKVVKDDYAITEQGAGTVRKLDKEETAKTEKKKKRERERRERERKNVHRLHNIFGDGQYLNRALILAIVPAWFAVLVFICLQADEFKFQQAACDAVFKNHLVGSFFYGPLLVFVGAPPPAIITGALLLGLLVLSWMVGAFRHRDKIWEGHHPKRFPLMKIWDIVLYHYPFIKFCTVIVIPMFLWIASLEDGAIFDNEHFLPTYGQLLAIFVAVPPLIQLLTMYDQLWGWFIDLAWVRLLTCRLHKREQSEGSARQSSESSVQQEEEYSKDPDTVPDLAHRPTTLKRHQQFSSYNSQRTVVNDGSRRGMGTREPSEMTMT